jgi:hypothetical protein
MAFFSSFSGNAVTDGSGYRGVIEALLHHVCFECCVMHVLRVAICIKIFRLRLQYKYNLGQRGQGRGGGVGVGVGGNIYYHRI